MKQFVTVLLASSAFLLAACGGGSGGPNPPSGGGPSPSSPPTQTPATTTNASGVVVDDANGSPLSGVHVQIMPWGPCGATPSPASSITPQNDGCPTPLPSPQVTTDPTGTFTLNGVPNGHYLLVIGNDVPATPPPGYVPSSCSAPCPSPTPVAFTVRAVVHDNVTLTGGNQTLKAPTLPPVPTYTPPAWETNGDYRLATLDATAEMPCYIAWEYERAAHSLGYNTPDEWLTENIRPINQYRLNPSYVGRPWPGNAFGFLTTGGANGAGDDTCDAIVVPIFSAVGSSAYVYAMDPRALWFAGSLLDINNNTTSLVSYPIDPRSFTDPNVAVWQ